MSAGTITKRHVSAAVVGNALEFYDFTTYAFFAAQIGRNFFPSTSPLNSLMLSLATFGAGFLTRPLGAVVIGLYADRRGRRPGMMISFMLMGAAIVALALCPSYAAIGPAAPCLVVVIRLVQGFALGGEVGPATAYLLEAAPPGRRGLYAALQPISQNMSALAAGVVGATISTVMSEARVEAVGWRIAMLLGAAVLPFGLLARRSLPETLHLEEHHPAPDAPGARTSIRVIVCSVAILAGGTVATYIQAYLTTYAGSILHMKLNVAFAATITYGLVGIVFNVAGAMVSDRIGRRAVVFAPRLILLMVILPAFWLLNKNRDLATLIGITALMTAFASSSGGAMMAAVGESMRKASRSATLGLVYAGTIAVFGGGTQLLATWLIASTGDNLAPAYYYMAVTVAALVGALLIRESAPMAMGRARRP